MNIHNPKIDNGKAFDWGRVSEEYAAYRDIYPKEFYEKIIDRGLCTDGQKVLDLGTGTGVLPRAMYKYGAKFVGTDISENQIAYAKILSEQNGMDIEYKVTSAENIDFPADSFDVVTACQCFWYFDCEKLMPQLTKILKKDGKLLILYMAWLPFEDKIAGESEQLVLKYNPNWSGARETIHPIELPKCVFDHFTLTYHDEYKLSVPFTRESWHGRMKACRGVGASLNKTELLNWEKEHRELLENIAPKKFNILHYAAIAELKKYRL